MSEFATPPSGDWSILTGTGIVALIVIGLVVAVIVIAVKDSRSSNSEKYKKCICNSRNERNCQDETLVTDLYDDNKLTEYTNLKSKGWQTEVENPGAVTYPVSTGCPWPDQSTKGWVAWDFSDFVG